MNNEPHKKLEYRPEIDGLRAIAVGVVLLYHAKLAMPGGFVGVDVFFVISGFLITSLILKDYESDAGFSIVRFWERRVRRIFPALVFVVIVTVVAGCFVLLPSDFLDLGKSVVAQALFAGNFYFWDTSGYFETSAWIRPLLHTWSLAVEEQFYLLMPLLFVFCSCLRRNTLRWVFGMVILLSLTLSIIQADRAPDTGFYLLPSRAWELLVGAILALFPLRRQLPKWIAELVGWSGLISIGLACVLYSHSTPFPGAAALLPVLGTAAIIWSTGLAAEHNLLRRVLSLQPLVFIGKISYSLYLWHWPILVYALYWRDNFIMPWPYRLALLGLSFLLAIISWKFVETPFRLRRVFPSRKGVLGFGLASLILYAGCGIYVIVNKGFSQRYPTDVVKIDSAHQPEALVKLYPKPSPTTLLMAINGDFENDGKSDKRIDYLVWGDSHAQAISPVFRKLARDKLLRVQFAAHPATCPALDYESFSDDGLRGESMQWSRAVVDYCIRAKVKNVVMHASWEWYYDRNPSGVRHSAVDRDRLRNLFAMKLAKTARELIKGGSNVWIIKRAPVHDRNYRLGLAKATLMKASYKDCMTKSSMIEYSLEEDEVMSLAVKEGAKVLNPSPYFYQGTQYCLLRHNDQLLYKDHSHLSISGALFLESMLDPMFRDDKNDPM
jgi:peptidoglycan/LPS O-acetylase OafA/YrhL